MILMVILLRKCLRPAIVLGLMSSLAWAQKAPQSPTEVSLSFAPLVERAAPAVVNIYAERLVRERTSLFSDPFFRNFFGDSFQGPEQNRIANSLGSGVILQADGLVVTNGHVVEAAQEIIVVLADRREYEAELLLHDERTDLAFLKIAADEPLAYLPLGDSDAVKVGDIVVAIGNPFSVGQTVTGGIVSALARAPSGVSDYRSFIQTDAAINPGNSGGALINHRGELIGINTAIFSRTGESLGIGFAVPVNMVKIVSEHAKNGTELIRPWSGITGKEIDWDIAQALGMSIPTGVLVENIYPRSPADRAGIGIRDVITHIDGYQFVSLQDLRFRFALKKNGEIVSLDGLRGGKPKRWRLTLELPPEIPKRKRTTLEGDHVLHGAVIENLSPKVNDEIGIDYFQTGVMIRDMPERALAARYGFRMFDILISINDREIESVADAKDALAKTEDSYRIAIVRNGQRLEKIFR